MEIDTGMKWSCSGFRDPETKVYDSTGLTDVRQFVQESSLTLEVDAEMEAVADTFRGVENLNGVFDWEGPGGSSGYQQMYSKHAEKYGNDHTCRATLVLKDAEPERIDSGAEYNWLKRGESQRKRLLSSLWKRLPQKTFTSRNSVELVEFARDLGNEKLHPSGQAHI